MSARQQLLEDQQVLALQAIRLAIQLYGVPGNARPLQPPPGGLPPGPQPPPPPPPPPPPLLPPLLPVPPPLPPLPPPVAPVPPVAPARRRRRVRGPNIPRVRLSTLGMSADYILRTYRLDMATITAILDVIQNDLMPQHAYPTAVPPLLKLLAVLHYCATGSFQQTVGLAHGVSQPMFTRILRQVLAAFMRVVENYIYMPYTQPEINHAKAEFYSIAQFPHIIGCIDCTHVAIVPPLEHEPAYRNRKMQHTLNVQMVCDRNLCFLQVCARFPGSCHDATVLRGSSLYDYMEGLAVGQRLWLLGDSGYPLLPWLMTPVRHPQTPAEQAYNAAHIATRNTVERAFGVLKARFRCIQRTGGALMYAPEKCGEIIAVCAILHNIAIRRNVPLPDELPGEDADEDDDEGGQHPPAAAGGQALGAHVRADLIEDFFH